MSYMLPSHLSLPPCHPVFPLVHAASSLLHPMARSHFGPAGRMVLLASLALLLVMASADRDLQSTDKSKNRNVRSPPKVRASSSGTRVQRSRG